MNNTGRNYFPRHDKKEYMNIAKFLLGTTRTTFATHAVCH